MFHCKLNKLRIILRIVFLFVLFQTTVVAAWGPVNAAIIVDARSGEVIYSYNEDVKIQPASLTKMMTLLLTFRALKQGKIRTNTKILISRHAASQKPCKLGIKAGGTITVQEAILALITKSANDIAVALAEHIGETEANFVKMMNVEAKRLKMTSTVFCNPSGWKNTSQTTTAKDMAKLSRALIKEYPSYYHLFATRQFKYNKQMMRNHNLLLGSRKGFVVDGIKTGFVNASGYNLAASATKGSTRLIAVVLGGKTRQERDKQVERLLRKGFSKITSRNIIAKTKQRMTISNLASVYYKSTSGGIYNKLKKKSRR